MITNVEDMTSKQATRSWPSRRPMASAALKPMSSCGTAHCPASRSEIGRSFQQHLPARGSHLYRRVSADSIWSVCNDVSGLGPACPSYVIPGLSLSRIESEAYLSALSHPDNGQLVQRGFKVKGGQRGVLKSMYTQIFWPPKKGQ